MTDIRCTGQRKDGEPCHHLLLRINGRVVEVKCTGCHEILHVYIGDVIDRRVEAPA